MAEYENMLILQQYHREQQNTTVESLHKKEERNK